MGKDAHATEFMHPRVHHRRARRPGTITALRRFASRQRLACAGAAILLAVALAVVAGPPLDRQPPNAVHISSMMTPPSAAWWLGTDDLGRDILSRLLTGGRISLGVGVAATLAAAAVGVPVGMASGFLGRWVDGTLMRLMDLLFSIPTIMLAIAIVGVLGPNLFNATLAIAIVAMPPFARLVRGQVLSLRETEFVQAARAIGATTTRILRHHLLPNLLALVVIQSTLTVSFAILTEAALSFLGLGVQPPTPSWGAMLRYGYPFLDRAPWAAVAPGVTIMITVLGLNLLGDGIRDVLDPRVRTG